MNKVKYKQAISNVLLCSQKQIFLYWKGRVALYAILKSMGVKEGDEVILPAFTCVVVPNAILYLGAVPVYVDINPDNYNADINKLNSAITPRTKVIICQNTFGLSSNIEEIIKTAKQNNLYTVEDCTHGFSGNYNGKPNGSYCDAAFYSTQWNKPFSTGIGGFLVVNNETLIDGIIKLESEKTKPKFVDELIISALIIFKRYFVNDYTQENLTKLFRFLSKHSLIIGSSQGDELENPKMPSKYFKDISSAQINEGIKQLRHLEKLNKLRKKNAADYTQFLKTNSKIFVSSSLFDNHLFLKYPLLVKDRDLFLKLAQKAKLNLGDWFISPLHPVKGDLSLWGFNAELFPTAVNVSQKIVNLPTDVKNNIKILNFLVKYLNLIE